MSSEASRGSDDAGAEPTPWPFVIAVGLFVTLATLAAFFLRAEDSGLEVIRSTDLTLIDDDTVQVVVPAQPVCDQILRAQVEFSDLEVFVELIVDDGGSCATGDVVVDVVLPESVGPRRLLAGVGRRHLPCGPAPDVGPIRCEADG